MDQTVQAQINLCPTQFSKQPFQQAAQICLLNYTVHFHTQGPHIVTKSPPESLNFDFSSAFKLSTESGSYGSWIFQMFWGEMKTRSHII